MHGMSPKHIHNKSTASFNCVLLDLCSRILWSSIKPRDSKRNRVQFVPYWIFFRKRCTRCNNVYELRSWLHRHGRWRLHNMPGRLVGPERDDGMRPLLPRHLLFRRRLLLHALSRRHLRQLCWLDLVRLHRPVRLHGGVPARHGLPSASRAHHRPLLRLLGCACSPRLARRAAVAGREPVQPTERRPHHCAARHVPAARRDL